MTPRRLAVVGSGVAGLTAACDLTADFYSLVLRVDQVLLVRPGGAHDLEPVRS